SSDGKYSAISEVFKVTEPAQDCDDYNFYYDNYNDNYDEDTFSWTAQPWSPCGRECNGYYRIGCFEEPAGTCPSPGRALTKLFESDDSMTPLLCAEKAARKGLRYSAVQYGRECYAGNSIQDYTTPSDYCESPCTGDSELTCGGGCANEIFEVSGVQTRDVRCVMYQWSVHKQEVRGCRHVAQFSV
ncbi:hypothetical protein DUNSADRAFT_802, partial [Dunaliella salina]